MRIANPIYDVVFKYLMEDNALAKLVLSTILQEEITELVFRPQERIAEIGSRYLTVYRLDFAARVKKASGDYQQVLIEIQKAKLGTDIMRFRRYLGEQYRDPNNLQPGTDRPRKALPLLTIYFLGHPLEHTKSPVIRVQRECLDMTTGKRLEKNEPFIESLTHDSYVIQIPYLRRERRTEVEELLQIFDQRGRVDSGRHLLDIDENEVPERYRPILRRLQRAVAEPKVAEAMDLEDEVLEELQDLEREVAQAQAEKEQAQAEKKQAQADRKQAEKRAERECAEKEQARAGQVQAEEQAERERLEKERLLALLKQAGIAP